MDFVSVTTILCAKDALKYFRYACQLIDVAKAKENACRASTIVKLTFPK